MTSRGVECVVRLRPAGIGVVAALVVLALTCPMATAQTTPWRGSPEGTPAAGPAVQPGQAAQPAQPGPTRQPHNPAAAGAEGSAPFQLTTQQQAEVDRILAAWEHRNSGVKRFSGKFKRWEWNQQFGPADAPQHEEIGSIGYEAPDKGFFRVEQTARGGQIVAVDERRAEHWVCDGQSIYQYDHVNKQVTEHRLPDELKGKAIAEGPLPFIFGATAASLRQRYFIRVVTPEDVRGQQTWLEVVPRFQKDAANFRVAQIILTNNNMMPFAMNIYSPNGRDRTAYQFYDTVVNDPLGWLKGNPFQGFTPMGWKKVVEDSGSAQVGRAPGAVGR